MPAIRDRGDGNQKRRERLAKIKKGPGVFVYLGKAVDHECIPTPLRVGRDVPVLDGAGLPVLDDSGRAVHQKSGTIAKDAMGNPILKGGPPKIKLSEIETFTVWGVQFPVGEPVPVTSEALAVKLRGMDSFEEVEEPAPAVFASVAPPPPRKKPGPKPKNPPLDAA